MVSKLAKQMKRQRTRSYALRKRESAKRQVMLSGYTTKSKAKAELKQYKKAGFKNLRLGSAVTVYGDFKKPKYMKGYYVYKRASAIERQGRF